MAPLITLIEVWHGT